jgi:hypothetical protein
MTSPRPVRARLLPLLFALAAATLTAVLPASAAQNLSPRQQKEAEAFAANNSLFFIYHEVGHLLIDQLRLPVLGREEDAADNMATYMLLRQETPRANRILIDSAHGWLLSGDKYDTQLDKVDLYDSHALDHQRAYQIVCLMVGKDPKLFAAIANEYGIDPDRQETCVWDYDLVHRSMERLLAEHAAGDEESLIQIVYSPVYGDTYKPAGDIFKRSGAFEQVARELRTGFAFPRTVTLRARACSGEANAFYRPSDVEVIFCYELMHDLLTLLAEQLPEDPRGSDRVGRTGSSSTD